MKKKKSSTIARVISIILTIVQIILLLFIVLKLFSAGNVPFVNWIEGLSSPLLVPFRGMFQPVTFSGKYVLDLSALFALIVYSIIGYVLVRLTAMIKI